MPTILSNALLLQSVRTSKGCHEIRPFLVNFKMVVYSFYIFDRHGISVGPLQSSSHLLSFRVAECIYKKRWTPRPTSSSKDPQTNGALSGQKALSAEDDAKLVFGTIFSLRNMVKKLGGQDDKYA